MSFSMLDTRDDQFLWVEKYRPQTISECILPEALKDTLHQFVAAGELPTLMFTGTAGVGKTTVAKALCNEIGAEYIMINGSDEGRMIETLRVKIKGFASTVSLTDAKKVVILDEADYMNCFLGKQKIGVVQDGVASFESIEDMIDKEFDVVSYNFKSNTSEITAGSVILSGIKEAFEVEFEDGSKMWCTEDHPFFDDIGGEKFIGSGDLFFINSIEVIDFINTRNSNESIHVSDKK